jgi:prepilin-type N-terminal cleavage/methylation domain-containing protein
MSNTYHKTADARGFTLVEVLVAIAVMMIGLLGLALTVARLHGTTNTSRYLSTEAILASEKLEDLDQRSSLDPYVYISVPGDTVGDLANNVSQNVTPPGGNPTLVDYFDAIQTSTGVGDPAQTSANIGQSSFTETLKTTDASGNPQFTVITHSPNGAAASTNQGAAPAASADELIYTRRWTIEDNQPTNGVRRVTVRVSVNIPGVRPFQMTGVRP